MKLKDGFVLGQVADEYVVLSTGDELDLNLMTTLNESGKFIWELLEKETTQEEIVEEILAQYEIDRKDAQVFVAEFVEKLEANGFLEM